jgi:hypothetical protein
VKITASRTSTTATFDDTPQAYITTRRGKTIAIREDGDGLLRVSSDDGDLVLHLHSANTVVLELGAH